MKTTRTFSITGMKCEHCRANVDNALRSLGGVCHVEVSLAHNSVTVEYDESVISPAQMKEAVGNVGPYEMTL